MANIVLRIGQQTSRDESLEKYVDVDMDSVYKTFASSVDDGIPAFAKENTASRDG